MSQTDDNEVFGEEPKEEKPVSMSLLGGIAQGDDSLEGDLPLGLDAPIEGGRSFLTQTPVIIVAVAIIAAGSLFAMRLAQGDLANDSAAAPTEAKVDGWLVKLESKDRMAKDDPLQPSNLSEILDPTLLDRVSVDITKHQVPIKFVKKNPFIYVFDDSKNSTGNAAPSQSQAERARQELMKKLQQELKQYRVNSIMTSRKGKFAMIDGELYQVGSHLGSFVIEDMDDMTIVLHHGQTKFKLTIDNSSTKPSRRRR